MNKFYQCNVLPTLPFELCHFVYCLQAFEVAAEKSKLIDEQAKQQSLRFHDYVETSHATTEAVESLCVEPTYVETVDSSCDITIKSTRHLRSDFNYIEKGVYSIYIK
jgi:hypothetical protein